jgi:outer membrane protein assembly factor BamD (BamD/ComL family)
MIDNIRLENDLFEEKQIEKVLFRAVDLFKKTGLTELAEKWDRILKNYVAKKDLT